MEHEFSPVVLVVVSKCYAVIRSPPMCSICFLIPVHLFQLLEDRTRMMAAMEVVNGSCNELRKIIEDKTVDWWKDIHMARNHSLQLEE